MSKIVFFLNGDFPEGNGSNSRIKAYAHALLDAGHEVELVFQWASAFNNEGINKQDTGIWERIPFTFITSVKRPLTFSGKLFQSIQAFFGGILYCFRNRKQYDIAYFYAPNIIFTWQLIFVSRWYGKKIIFEQTELKSAVRHTNTPFQRFLRYLNRWDESHSQHWCDHLIVISKNLHTHYKEYFPKTRLTLIPIVVDLNRFTNHAMKKQGLIGYIGSFGYKDGVEGIINAFEIAHKSNPELRLRLIGYCEYFTRIKGIIDAKQLNEQVELTGLVLYDRIPKLLEECELLVMNRIDTKYAHYGSPTKLAEYLASGVPTLVTNVGDVKNYLTHGHDTIIIPPENDIALSEAILDCFGHPEKYKSIGQQGRITCEHNFSHSAQLQKLLDIVKA